MAKEENKNIFSKITGFFGWWVNSMLGRSNIKTSSKNEPVTPSVVEHEKLTSQPKDIYASEDSVAKDIQNFKKFFGQVSKKVGKKSQPLLDATQKQGKDLTNELKKVSLTSSLLFRVGVIIGTLLIIVFVAATVLKMYRGGKLIGNGTQNITSVPTPTPIPYEPSQPSIYSTDSDLQIIEENLKLIDKEIYSQVIRESGLNPPQLDFNVSF